jgi:hypothetical protein
MVDNWIELEIGAGSGSSHYLVRVVHASVGGHPMGVVQLDIDDLIGRVGRLEPGLLASLPGRRTADDEPLRRIGRQLFETLFVGPVAAAYRASLTAAREQRKDLRVVLRLTGPELAALPWEALWDPELKDYVCRGEPLVRHVPAPDAPPPLPTSTPLRILGLTASPGDLAPLNEDAVRRRLEDTLAGPSGAGQIRVEWLAQASWAAMQHRVLAGQWDVVHFIGHGRYDRAGDEGQVALVGPDGRAEWVGADWLANLLDRADPMPRLVVLNSPSSGTGGPQYGSPDSFPPTAATLARRGISAVAALQFGVGDLGTEIFSRRFYTALAAGRGVDEAVQSGRAALLEASSLEWLTPVLYLRGDATRPFTLTAPALDQRATITLRATIRNRSSIIDSAHLSIQGLPAQWFQFDPPKVNLFPQDQAHATLSIYPGPDGEIGTYEFSVVVTSAYGSQTKAQARITLAPHQYSAEVLQPAEATESGLTLVLSRDVENPATSPPVPRSLPAAPAGAEAAEMLPFPLGRPASDMPPERPRPPARKRPTRDEVDVDQLVAAAVAKVVKPGRLMFNPPSAMRLGETRRVEVRITRTDQLDEHLTAGLRGSGVPQLETISTSVFMGVTLRGMGFDIESYSETEQAITKADVTTWEFDIRPVTRGQLTLLLSVVLRIPIPGQLHERRSIPALERTVNVDVSTVSLVRTVAARNWQWLVATALGVGGAIAAWEQVLH